MGGSFPRFQDPFEAQIRQVREQLLYPVTEAEFADFKKQLGEIDPSHVGALLVEPIQGRGGKVVPHKEFLAALRLWCDENEVVLIFDEIYTGFHRTGKLWACEWEQITPDVICLGKALSGGYPISACVGLAQVMDQWPKSQGEALHTSTFLGNPVGCAMALASIGLHRNEALELQVLEKGRLLKQALGAMKVPFVAQIRGRGLMIGVELSASNGQTSGEIAGKVLSRMLAKGVIMLADGDEGNVLALTPPFDLNQEALVYVVNTLEQVLLEAAG